MNSVIIAYVLVVSAYNHAPPVLSMPLADLSSCEALKAAVTNRDASCVRVNIPKTR
jgi:hypothetical protein